MQRALRDASVPLHLDHYSGGESASLLQLLDTVARDHACPTNKKARPSAFVVPRLAQMEADLTQLLDDLDRELNVISTRLGRAMAR